jgi:hypothetical protein
MTVVMMKIAQGKGKGRRRRKPTLAKLYVWNLETRRNRKITGSQAWWWLPRLKTQCEYESVTNTLCAPLKMEDSK